MSEKEIKPAVVDHTVAAHVACESHGDRYGIDWIWHHDGIGLLHPQSTIDRLTAERDAVRSALGNDALNRFIEKHGKPVPLVVALHELCAAAIRARRCLAWACEQRPEFNAEYEALDAAIDAAKTETGT
ncbi:hypothetical protein ACIPR8_11205 [Stenotrophomonas sp. LARHCG68]